MRTSLLSVLACLFLANFAIAADSPVRVSELTTEHLVNPVGVGFAQPRFSWKLISDRAGEVQTAYEVRAASSSDKLESKPDLWSSGKVNSDQSVLVQWGGQPLASRAQVVWQVRIWDKDSNPSAWSDPASLELGLLDSAKEWKGQWITADLPRFDIEKEPLTKANWISSGSTPGQATAVRFTLDLPADAKIRGAVVDAAAEGLIALYVNGKATLQGPSSHTAPFHADFPQQLTGGKNIIALSSGAIRARGGAVVNSIAAHGVIELETGDRIEFNTDGSWKAAVQEAPAGRGGRGPTGPPPVMGQWYSPDYDETKLTAATVAGPYSSQAPIRSADGTIGPGRYLRKTFTLKGPVAKARLYATALGVYEASINGHLVSDDQLSPGWTDYFKRVMVQTYDVTKLLAPGQTNVVGALLGDGWYAGRVGWMGLAQYAKLGDRPDFNAQLEITYADGTSETIATDATWKGGPGEVVGSDQQLGEVLDARNAVPWNEFSFRESTWTAAVIEKHDGIQLDPDLGVPVRRLKELTPKKISRIDGMWIVDFGQNMVGHTRITATGPAGQTIEVLHGEMLNPDGTVYNENLRQAISYDEFTLGGTGKPETFEPHFTFHGFRYAQITGYPGELSADNIRGIVVGSDTPDTGTFESSNKDVNQLFSNIRWGQRGNFVSVPTDCPQRDERQGWMGDAQVFAPTAAYNSDVAAFYRKWMVDVDDGQLTTGDGEGAYCVTSPRVGNPNPGYPIWADAGVLVPWDMFTAYGDRAFLETNYDHMAKYVDYCVKHSTNLLESGGVGDNLAPFAARGGFGAPATGPTTGPAGGRGRGGGGGAGGFGGGINNTTAVLDNCYFAHSAQIVARAAAILGKTDDAAKYDKLYHDIVGAFDKAYMQPDGGMVAGTQSTYVVALSFGMIPDDLREGAIKHLTDDITAKEHLSTGFIGVGFLNTTLSAIGRNDLAYKLLLTDTYPSWLFPVKEGATTIWERWDGYTPEKGFQASSMNSFNHYSLGAVGKWLYCGAAGIVLDENHPGFKHFDLAPQFSGALTMVKATENSPYGEIVSSWEIFNGNLTYTATVPPNSSATLTLPIAAADMLSSGSPAGETEVNGNVTTISLPPGTYHFGFPVSKLK